MTVQHRRPHDLAPPAPPALHALICALWAAPIVLGLAIIAYAHAPVSHGLTDRPTLVRDFMQPARLHVGEPAGPGFFVQGAQHGSLYTTQIGSVAQGGLVRGGFVTGGFETGTTPVQPAAGHFAPLPGQLPGPMKELQAGVSRNAGAPVDETRSFVQAHAVDAISIRADGILVQIAGIVSPHPESRCERLDGVIEPCRERALGRLAVVLQGRRVSCHLTRRLAADAYVGTCQAGAIELAADLLRFRLVERQTAPSTNSVPAGASL